MRHFIDLSEWSSDELRHLIDLAVQLKQEWKSGGNPPILAGKALAMVFQKPSLRTRVSFEMCMQHLGGHALMIGPDEIGLGKRESIADVARVLSRYVQGIMARVFAHDHVVQLAVHASVPVINGLSDDQHPCQAMADLLTIYEHYGRTEGLRVVYVGDGNNVAASLGQVAAHFGMSFATATPPGFELSEAMLSPIRALASQHGGAVETFHDPLEAVRGADVIYTDTWVSMGQEVDAARKIEALRPYQVNAELLANVGKPAIVMHCLPAHRGLELTDDVADGPQSVIFDQAENRLHAQKAILVHLMA